MKKILDFECNGNEYILKNTNPNEKRGPFKIDKAKMEFNTLQFYEYIFSDIDQDFEININNLVDPSDKEAQRVYSTIEEICAGVISKMKEK